MLFTSNNLRFFFTIIVGLLLFILVPLTTLAQFNPKMNYQGKLTTASGVAVPDGLYNMNFWLVPTQGGATSTAIWNEVRTSGNRVQVVNGLFSVMLGDVATLGSVNFNQTLYLGVEVGGISTTTPTWDGEMSPRKILGAVPAAFVANFAATAGSASSSLTVGGVSSSSFLRSDEADTMTASSSSPLLTLIQNGVGKVLALFSGATEIFTALSNGNIGIGTTTPASTLSVQGNSGVNPFNVASSTGNSLFSILGNGNVGIGSSTPQDRLTVIGTTTIAGTGSTSPSLSIRGALNMGFDINTVITSQNNQTLTFLTRGHTGDGNVNYEFKGTNSSISVQNVNDALSGGFTETYGSLQYFLRNEGGGLSGVIPAGQRYKMFAIDINGRVGSTIPGSTGVINFRNLLDDGYGRVGIGTTTPTSLLTLQGVSGTTTDTFRVASSTGATALAVLANRNVEVPGQIISAGIEWAAVNSVLPTDLTGVAYGNGRFVAVTITGQAAYSDNGLNWSTTTAQSGGWRSVTYGNGLFVAVASAGTNRVMTSPDGITWTARSAAGNNDDWRSVAYGNGLFVAVGRDTDLAMTSPDGINWTVRSAAGNNDNWMGVTYGNGLFVAVAESGDNLVMTSPDGITWTPRSAAGDNDNWQGITYGNGLFVAVGWFGDLVMTSPDGINWTARTPAGGGDDWWQSVTYGNGLFVAVSYTTGDAVMTSPDGINWTLRSAPGNIWHRVAYGNGLFVAVGYDVGAPRAIVSGKITNTQLATDNIFQGGLSVFDSLRVGTTTTASSLFVQSVAGLTPFTVASSTGTSMLTLTQAGNLGIGSSTPSSQLTVAGNTYIGGELRLVGALRDGANASGTIGMILQTTGTSTRWVATSTLGISGGASTFLALTDTPSSYTANRIMFTNGAANALIDSANFTFDGVNLGLGAQSQIAFGGTNYLYASSTNDSVSFGENAGAGFTNLTTNNIAIGFDAGRFASTTSSDNNIFLGSGAGFTNTGSYNNLIGVSSGAFNAGTGNNIFGYYAGFTNTGNFNEMFGYEAGYNLQSTSSIIIGTEAFRGGSGDTGFSAVNNVALGFQAGYAAQTGSNNNILLGYRAADNLTTGNNNIIIGYDIDNITATTDNALNIGNLIFGTGVDGTGTTLSSGNIGIGTSTPGSKLTVAGNTYIGGELRLVGGLRDGANATGTLGMILQTTGTSTRWVATSTLGLGDNTFTGLAQTQDTLTANRVIFTNAGGTSLTDSANFTFDGTNLGFSTTTGIAFGATRAFTADTNNGILKLGASAGSSNTGTFNTFIGNFAGANNSGSFNELIGYQSGYFNQGAYNQMLGYEAGYNLRSTSSVIIGGEAFRGGAGTSPFVATNNVALGYRAGYAAQTGSDNNILLGYRAADNLTTGNNNIIIGYDIDNITATADNVLNIGNLIFGTGLTATGTTLATGNMGIGSTTPSARLTVQGVSGSAFDTFRVASSTGATALAVLANRDVELPGQLISAGIEWTGRSAAGNDDSWRSVTYGNGLFVAVSDSGDRVMTSPDGINWATTTAAGNNDQWRSVTYGNGLFVAVSQSGDPVMTSPDGITWTARSAAGNNDDWQSVTYGNGLFVAVGAFNVDRVMTSPDGINWTARSAAGNNDQWRGVTYANGLFVAVGDSGDRVITSPDGITWTARSAAGNDDFWQSITYGNGLFVAVSGGGDRVITSPDGITWTVRSAAGNDDTWRSVTYGNGLFVAVSQVGDFVMTSPDGITWTVRSAAGNDDFWQSITYGNGQFVAVGVIGDLVMTSGKTFTNSLATNNIFQGGLSVFDTFRVGTTTSAASLFVQSVAGLTPFTVASSTGTSMLTLTQAGNFGIGSSTPSSQLTVAGNTNIGGELRLVGALRDGANATGTIGMILQTTGTSTRWVATSTLGISGGASTFLALTDTPSSYTANRVMFTNSGATALTDSANFVFDGTNLGVGTSTPGSRLTVDGSVSVSNNINLQRTTTGGANGVINIGGQRYIHNYAIDASQSNQFMGINSGNFTLGSTTNLFLGVENLGVGGGTLSALTEGSYNTAVGLSALGNTTSGGSNTAVGWFSMVTNASGGNNSAFGRATLAGNISGSRNIAFGNSALEDNTSGDDNTALGAFSALNNTIGRFNVAVGAGALASSVDSDSNVAVGFNALNLTLGGNNTAVGREAGYNVTTGANNILLGFQAANNLTTGANNLVIGYDVDIASTTGSNQLNIGNLIFGTNVDGTGTSLSSGNIGIGTTTPSSKLTVAGNTYLGGELSLVGALRDGANATGTLGMILQTTGTSTRWVATSTLGFSGGGASTFLALTDTPASYTANRVMFTNSGATALTDSANFVFDGTNLGIGTSTPGSRLTVAGNIAVSGGIILGSEPDVTLSVKGNNLILGTYGLANATNFINVYSNTAVGLAAGNTLVQGWENVFLGTQAGIRLATSSGSVVIGAGAVGNGYGTTDAGGLVVIGQRAGFKLQSGASRNTIIGTSAGEEVTTGANNILLGFQAANNLTAGDNNLVIGYDVDIASTTGSNQLNIGNLIFGTGVDGTGSTLSSGNIGIGTTTPSSKLSIAGDIAVTNNVNLQSNSVITVAGGRYIHGYTLNNSFGVNQFMGFQSGNFTSGSSTNLSLGIDNLGVGRNTLGALTEGSNNVAIGPFVLGNTTTGEGNAALGHSALLGNTTGRFNSVLGNSAMEINIIGENNTAVGAFALQNSLGNNNTAVGREAGSTITAGEANTIVGINSGAGITTGSYNTIIGANVTGLSSSLSNNIIIADGQGNRRINVDGTGNVGIGTTTPGARLTIERLGFNTAGTAGLQQHFTFTNSTPSAAQFGNSTFLKASTTATTTVVGSIFRLEDSTTFGNTVRGLEVQTDRGNNTRGENTALSGFARTFGVRGTTAGDAGATFEPAGVYGETQGTTQGNAIRGYSSTITSAALLKLFQDTSAYTGTGLLMNFGNSGGSFSSTTASKFIDLQNAGSSLFTVGARGMTTIGNGTTVNNAGLQIGYGGICVDNDGSCNASTTGRISAVSYHTGNSDLAEMYFSSDDLKTGEVVALKNGLSINRATENNEDRIIGVVTTKAGLLLGFDDESLRAGEEGYGVALAGRVPVRLSNENGEIKAGDELMLSSVPGVAMKASSTGTVVGIALEDFNDTRAYSDTYINQFGDDLVDPVVTPINKDSDPRINDGCYYGAGSASGEAPCVPLKSPTVDGRALEAQALAEAEAQADALAALANISSEDRTLPDGREVQVGQIVMFVSLGERDIDEAGKTMIAALVASAPGITGDLTQETIWSRLVTLANNFVDGVLSVFTLKADRVEVKEELCVDGVCLNADDLRRLLDGQGAPVVETPEEPEPEPTPDSTPEPVPTPEPDSEESTPEEVVEETIVEEETEPVVEEVVEEVPVEEVVEETPEPEPTPEPTV